MTYNIYHHYHKTERTRERVIQALEMLATYGRKDEEPDFIPQFHGLLFGDEDTHAVILETIHYATTELEIVLKEGVQKNLQDGLDRLGDDVKESWLEVYKRGKPFFIKYSGRNPEYDTGILQNSKASNEGKL